MKIRLVSDLHIDYNDIDDFGFMGENQDVLLIAGDTAGSTEKEIEFLQKLKGKTICIGGNHLGYDYLRYRQINALLGYDSPLDNTKEDCIKTLTTYNFDNVTYLENSYIEVGNICIFGGTMYSDFLLYGEKHKEECMFSAERWLNDFRYVHTFDKKEKIVRPVTADDYIKWNKSFMKELKKCLEKTDKDIIVLSHFAPSIKSISGKYLAYSQDRLSQPGTCLNAVYANNLEDFIQKNPKIKYWVHGHMHECHEYKIGNCTVLCNPYGYYGRETEMTPQEYIGKTFEI